MVLLNGGKVKKTHYPNGESCVTDDLIYCAPTNLVTLRYEDDSDLVLLMFIKNHLASMGDTAKLVIDYMPYSRMDRKINAKDGKPGYLFTLKAVCDFINWLKFEEVYVVEPHSKVTMTLLNNSEAIYPVIKWLPKIKKEIGFTEKDHIVFPDRGAYYRYDEEDRLGDVLVMKKTRDPNTGAITNMELAEGTVNPGATCVIIDDLCSKGGTFAWAGSILKAKGASKVYLVVTHCEDTIFEGGVLKKDSPIDGVFTTNTILKKLAIRDITELLDDED